MTPFDLDEAPSLPSLDGNKLRPSITKQTTEAINRGVSSTGETETQAQLTNTDQTQGSLATGETLHRENRRLGMMGDDSLSQAIARKAQQSYQSDLNRLQQSSKLNAHHLVDQKMKLATNALFDKQQYDYEIYKRQMIRQLDEEAARGQVLGTILGVVGSVFGGMAGSGGSEQGGKLGSAFGKEFGS